MTSPVFPLIVPGFVGCKTHMDLLCLYLSPCQWHPLLIPSGLWASVSYQTGEGCCKASCLGLGLGFLFPSHVSNFKQFANFKSSPQLPMSGSSSTHRALRKRTDV